MFLFNLKRYYILLKVALIRDAYKRAAWLKKIGYFAQQGENCCFWTLRFGTEPYLISFGNNVVIATGACFVTHDVFSRILRTKFSNPNIQDRTGTIQIGNNVFIGTNTTIMYNVKIGNNVLVAAGSVVTKDIPDGVIVGGVPAKVIGKFDDYQKKCLEFSDTVNWLKDREPFEIVMEKQKLFFKI